MPRSGRLRNLICKSNESVHNKKMSFVPPFVILVIEFILLIHAIFLNEIFVIILTLILLTISLIEAVLVSSEIHRHYVQSNFSKILTIRLNDFITENREKNVKKIVEKFIDENPEYHVHRSEIYHTACQVLETHKEEEFEKKLTKRLKEYISKRKEANVDDIVEGFVNKYGQYKKYRSEVYEKTCQIKSK